MWLRLVVALLSFSVVSLYAPEGQAGALRVGSVSETPANEIKEFQPLADYLAARLGGEGVDTGVVVVTQNNSQMANLLKEGKVDLYIDSPFPVLLTQNLADNKLLLRRWKGGVTNYSSVIFARKDAGISTLEQLVGKMVAFEEPFSTGSYFLPKAYMIEAGLKLSRKPDWQAAVGSGQVGYVISGDDRNTLAWVLKGRVAAGAMNNGKYEKLAQNFKNELVILAHTASVPRHLVTYRKTLDPQLVKAIRALLMGMEHSNEGRSALKAFGETARFDELPEESMKTLETMRSKLKSQIESEQREGPR